MHGLHVDRMLGEQVQEPITGKWREAVVISMHWATTHVQLVPLLDCHLLALSAKYSRQHHSHKFDQGG
jgi:hypothetical protein